MLFGSSMLPAEAVSTWPSVGVMSLIAGEPCAAPWLVNTTTSSAVVAVPCWNTIRSMLRRMSVPSSRIAVGPSGVTRSLSWTRSTPATVVTR